MDVIRKFEPFFGEWYAESFIDAGSFGRVYKIYRDELNNRFYSALKYISIPSEDSELKQLRADGMDDESISTYYDSLAQNISSEITLMDRLKGNTNIVSFEDSRVMQKPGGVGYDIFIRMQLLESLMNRITAEQLPVGEVVKLGVDICSALIICAKNQIIHRDIKPENIFISPNGDYKLGDFGIARQLEKTASFMSRKGTYNYMAPEVYKGEQYGATCDIYSLGLVMYRLLNNGRLPFLPPAPAPITPDDRENAIIRRMKGEELPAPCAADPALSRIVLKACAFDPKERYTSAEEMRRDLMRTLSAEPAEGPVQPTPVKTEPKPLEPIKATPAPVVPQTEPKKDGQQNAGTVPDEIVHKQVFCPYCGKPQQPGKSFCSACGKPLTQSAKPGSVPTDAPKPGGSQRAKPGPVPADAPKPGGSQSAKPGPVPTGTPKPAGNQNVKPGPVPNDPPKPIVSKNVQKPKNKKRTVLWIVLAAIAVVILISVVATMLIRCVGLGCGRHVYNDNNITTTPLPVDPIEESEAWLEPEIEPEAWVESEVEPESTPEPEPTPELQPELEYPEIVPSEREFENDKDAVLQLLCNIKDDQGVERTIWSGSCFLISPDTVLTCYHCVDSEYAIYILKALLSEGYSVGDFDDLNKLNQKLSQRITYQVTVSRDVKISAKVINGSPSMDFAILQLSKPIYNRTTLKIRKSKTVKLTEDVYVISIPGDSDLGTYDGKVVTFTRGVVSKVEGLYSFMYENGTQVSGNFIQTDCRISSGNSGGPVVDAAGNVIGIAVVTGDYYCAVAIDQVTDVMDALGIEYTVYGNA